VRLTATSGLWESEDPSLIAPLIRLMKEDSSDEVQAAAATALGKFAMLAEYKKLRPVYAESIGSSLLSVINDKTKPLEVRRRALEAISPLSFPGVIQAISIFYRSPEEKFKISAVYAMGKSCNTSFLPLLKKELLSSDAETRYEAATALGEMGEEESVPYLADLIEDPDLDVQMAVIRALGQIGGAQARRHLQTAMKSESEATKQAASEALDELESEENPFDVREEA
jgi:HEAT repeat protein